MSSNKGSSDAKAMDASPSLAQGQSNNPPQSSSSTMNAAKYRKEAVDRRKLRSNEIIKARKRKLAELYFVTKSPFIPISDQKLSESEINLSVFLDKNDITRGHKFDINTLAQISASRSSSSSTPMKETPRKLASSSAASSSGTPSATATARRQSNQAQGQRKISPPTASTPRSSISPPVRTQRQLQQAPQAQQQQQQQQHISSSLPASAAASTSAKATPVGTAVSSKRPSIASAAEEPPLKLQKTTAKNEPQLNKASKESADAYAAPQAIPNEPQQTLETRRTDLVPVATSSAMVVSQPPIQEVFPMPPIPKDYKPSPTLSTLIEAYAESKAPDLSEKELMDVKRELDIANIDIQKLCVLLMPGHLPAKIPDSSPLAELYYLTQTCPLSKLIPITHKALTTETYESALLEGKLAVVYSRIEELKRQKKWSLRQPIKYMDPFLAHPGEHKSHWGNLLDEAKWMALDFKEGRKFKMVQSYFIAQAVTDYWTYGKIMCVKTKPVKLLEQDLNGKDVASGTAGEAEKEADEEQSSDTIDVSVLLKRPDAASEIPPRQVPEYLPEQSPKTQQPFKMYADKNELTTLNSNIIESLPIFEAFTHEKEIKEAPITSVSKLLTPLEEEDQHWQKIMAKESYFIKGSSYATEKGLFGFSSTKRLTFIRPPIPPPLKYLDLRIPTIWLPEDDRHLIRYVAEYQFNWSIIAAHLSARPTKSFFSNIERRTPWQCFERYIQLNNKFQFSDMRGGYTPQAQVWLEAAHKAQSTTKRRISPLGVGNESIQRGHRRLRWASMFEAIRKLMKKRETTPKPNTTHAKRDDSKKINAPTPQDLARLKYERDKAIQEAYAHQNTNLNMKKTSSQQQQPTTGTPSNSSAQIAQVQRQLAAAAVQVNAAAGKGSPAQQQQAQVQQAQILAAQRLAAQQALQQRGLSGTQSSPMERQGSANGNNNLANANAIVTKNGIVGVPPVTGIQASNAALQAQQLRLQQQQQQALLQQQAGSLSSGGRSKSNPVGTITAPNGQSYTPEQLQQLMKLQRQRQAQQAQAQAQQLQSAPASTASSKAGTPVMLGANLVTADGSKSMSPVMTANTLNSPNTVNNNSVNTKNGIAAQGRQGGVTTPGKNYAASFSNSQVTAIVQQIQAQHPNLNKQQVSRLAASYLHNLSTQQQQAQHRAMQGQVAKAMKASASNPTTPLAQQPAQLADGSQSAQPAARNLASSLQMLNSAQLTKLASSPTLTPTQRAQILAVQQQRLRNAGQTVMAANNRSAGGSVNGSTVNMNNRMMASARSASGGIPTVTHTPTPQELAAQRAKLQEQMLQQQQQEQQQNEQPDGTLGP